MNGANLLAGGLTTGGRRAALIHGAVVITMRGCLMGKLRTKTKHLKLPILRVVAVVNALNAIGFVIFKIIVESNIITLE